MTALETGESKSPGLRMGGKGEEERKEREANRMAQSFGI